MGAGTERAQRFAAEDFARYSAAVKAAAEDGTAMLFAGTAMELLGASVTDRDGDTYPGIGLASFTTVQGKRRIVGDVYGVTALFPEAVVGFMNKCGQIRGVEAPLLTSLSLGFGNEAEKGPEGFHWKNVFASELTGPVLVKNPRSLEAVADAICTRRGHFPARGAAVLPLCRGGLRHHSRAVEGAGRGPAVIAGRIRQDGRLWAAVLFLRGPPGPCASNSSHRLTQGSATMGDIARKTDRGAVASRSPVLFYSVLLKTSLCLSTTLISKSR